MIDSHCHLQEFEDIQAVVSNASKAGITSMICCGSGAKSSQKAVELASKYKEIFATVGIHPEDINDRDETELRKLLKMPKVVAVGECGLDFLPETREEEKSAQRELFKFNIDLAKETRLPMVVHCRNAFADIFQIFDRTRNNPYDPLVMMHCFTGNMEQMREGVRRGWYISLGGIITFKKSDALREVAKAVPEDKLLVETDAPYLAPESVRGSRNVPTNVKIVAKFLAELRSTSINQIDEVTSKNARQFFGI